MIIITTAPEWCGPGVWISVWIQTQSPGYMAAHMSTGHWGVDRCLVLSLLGKGSIWSPRDSRVFLLLESQSVWGPPSALPVSLIVKLPSWGRKANAFCWLKWKWEQKCVRVLGLPTVKPLPSDELRHVEINPGHLGEQLGIWCPNESPLIYYAAIWLKHEKGLSRCEVSTGELSCGSFVSVSLSNTQQKINSFKAP